jgi:hypothetical protein
VGRPRALLEEAIRDVFVDAWFGFHALFDKLGYESSESSEPSSGTLTEEDDRARFEAIFAGPV